MQRMDGSRFQHRKSSIESRKYKVRLLKRKPCSTRWNNSRIWWYANFAARRFQAVFDSFSVKPGSEEQCDKLRVIVANLEEQQAGYVNLLNLITVTRHGAFPSEVNLSRSDDGRRAIGHHW